ncbi:hypothetical protein [Lysobacter firmicutimachus]|uniref:Lipoprotein n=1 Tax=Lysobacter firmicutimachus TaxID=1792846 RepID=A0ABU8D5C1_9GAMM
MRSHPPRFSVFVLALALTGAILSGACGDKTAANGSDGEGDSAEALPAPEGAGRGGVTGMPATPGPGQIGPPADAATAPQFDEDGNPLPGTATPADGVDGTLPADGGAVAAEPTPDDAVAVVRDYYAAINHGQFDQAYALWSDGGRASGQSAQQFAAGFADTTGVSVELLPPGPVDAGAGQRHIEVPVAITATQRDGSQRKYVGAYVLRRSVVDGASDEQRAWRIGSADIREVRP